MWKKKGKNVFPLDAKNVFFAKGGKNYRTVNTNWPGPILADIFLQK